MKSFLKNNKIILFKKIFKNTFFLCCFFVFFLNKNSFAEIVRITTFSDRAACEKSRGSWRDFGNSCVDKCIYKFDKYAVCSYAITFGCDCGKNRCLFEDKCIHVNEYKKIYENQNLENEKTLNEIRDKRKNVAKKFENDYLSKLSGVYNFDPNRINPNRHNQVERELPANSFKGTNRMLIYNHIIKKHNDKVMENAKINAEKNAKIAENNKENQELDYKNIVKSLKENKEENLNQNNENIAKNTPIIIQPIEENVKNINSFNNINNLQESVSSKVSDVIDEFSKISAEKNKKESNLSNIPPVYVKRQNGEIDFKNSDVINNIENIPQFTN